MSKAICERSDPVPRSSALIAPLVVARHPRHDLLSIPGCHLLEETLCCSPAEDGGLTATMGNHDLTVASLYESETVWSAHEVKCATPLAHAMGWVRLLDDV